jgi:hypothetical protein
MLEAFKDFLATSENEAAKSYRDAVAKFDEMQKLTDELARKESAAVAGVIAAELEDRIRAMPIPPANQRFVASLRLIRVICRPRPLFSIVRVSRAAPRHGRAVRRRARARSPGRRSRGDTDLFNVAQFL